jgi:hypothetical protein
MKTVQHILIFLALSATQLVNSQNLHVNGQVVSYKDEAIPAHFALFRNDTLIQSGYTDEFRLKLTLDQNYNLQIYRTGFQTKSIAFSTVTPINKKFKFNFVVTLNKLPGVRQKDEVKTVGYVFFDEKKKLFDYCVY